MKKVLLHIILVSFLLSSYAVGGEISFELKEKIKQDKTGEPVSVLIKLTGQIDSKKFNKELTASSKIKAERSKKGIKELKEKHLSSQAAVAALLKSNAHAQKMIKQHWIVNIIEAELTKDEITTLAARSDVEIIMSIPEIEMIEPDFVSPAPAQSLGVESNISYVNAPAAWADGFTGEGRIVCSFDTGVEGTHPALFDNWKGHDGDSAAAWFDRLDTSKAEPFPHAILDCGFSGCNSNHGSHTMGIMVGRDNATGDTIGVAPGAKWISAAVIDVLGTSIINAYEWAIDPDGDPNTFDDMPDVINHSWGVKNNYAQCENLFYDMIEFSEALGIVNIFAGGNSGSSTTSSTMYNPAARALDSLDCFAVGNINHSTETIYINSSRGPSLCVFGAIKPNVVAPGYNIRSAYANGLYGNMTGTSMAAPHVAGLVALLRQKNPNATVEEIKRAILTSTNNMGQSVPNNDIGWGRIDCMAALDALDPVLLVPHLKIAAFDHNPISPGGTVTGTVLLRDDVAIAPQATGLLLDNNDAITIISGALSFGDIINGDTARSAENLEVVISDTVTIGSILSMDLEISLNSNAYDTLKIFFLVNPMPEQSFLTHTAGNIDFTITNFGTYGIGASSYFPIGGEGFSYQGGADDMFEGGLMIGKNFDAVSNGVHTSGGEPDADFKVTPGGDIRFVTPNAGVTQQSYARFNDDRAESPIGLDIIQQAYSFDDPLYVDFIIMSYIIKNTTGSSINNLLVGLYFDWDITSWTTNSGGYEAVGDYSWIAQRENASTIINYRGVKVLGGLTATSFTQPGIYTYDPNSGGDGFSQIEKMQALANGFVTADSFKNVTMDLFQVVATELNLAPGQTDTAAFAILAAETSFEFAAAASNAADAYSGVVTDVDDDGLEILPDAYELQQNYPNPFNPSTTIAFVLKKKIEYNLSIYNLVGQKVHQFNGLGVVGVNELVWDASGAASGIYFYKLVTDEFEAGKKMILLK